MTASKIFSAIQKEFDQAILEQPRWSLDASQAGAMLMDKAGELMQATTDCHEGTSRRAGDMATSRQQMQEEAERSGRALVEQTRRDLQQLETQRRRQAAEDAEAARQQALQEVQADCDALRQRAGAKMPQAVDTILRRVVQE